jgi:hypothetical protein
MFLSGRVLRAMIIWGRWDPPNFQYRRQIQSRRGRLDRYQHQQCAHCPICSHRSLHRQRNDRVGRIQPRQHCNAHTYFNNNTESYTGSAIQTHPSTAHVAISSSLAEELPLAVLPSILSLRV